MRNYRTDELTDCKFIKGAIGFINDSFNIYIEEFLQTQINIDLTNQRYNLYYLGRTQYNRIFILISKKVIHDYRDILEDNLIIMEQSKWLKQLRRMLQNE